MEITTELGPDDTRRLIAEQQGGGLTTYERLLSALSVAFGGWLGGARGGIAVLLGGHGREDIFPDVDLSRTIGWFTATYPFLLHLPQGPDLASHTEHVAEELRTVPRNGFDFAAARYLTTDPVLRDRLAAVPTPQVAFDFARALTTRDDASANGPLGPARMDATGPDRPADALRAYAVQVFTTLSRNTLRITVRGSGELISADRLDELACSFVRAVLR